MTETTMQPLLATKLVTLYFPVVLDVFYLIFVTCVLNAQQYNSVADAKVELRDVHFNPRHPIHCNLVLLERRHQEMFLYQFDLFHIVSSLAAYFSHLIKTG